MHSKMEAVMKGILKVFPEKKVVALIVRLYRVRALTNLAQLLDHECRCQLVLPKFSCPHYPDDTPRFKMEAQCHVRSQRAIHLLAAMDRCWHLVADRTFASNVHAAVMSSAKKS